MRPRSPESIRRIEDSYLKIPPIEDGNTPSTALDQGFIYTAESIDSNFYDTQYSSPISDFRSRHPETGKDFIYEITVDYTAGEGVSANTPGLYGSNLISKGNFFTIVSLNDTHDYIRGIVINILRIDVVGPVGADYGYSYTLLCNINEGDPLGINVGDNFVWKRQIFTDALNQLNFLAPNNLLSTVKTDGVYFRWNDPTQEARKFNLRIREQAQSDGGGITYYFLPGLKANGDQNISVETFIGSVGLYDKIFTTIKITNGGTNYAIPPIVSVIGTGTGAYVNTELNNSGSLKKEEFRVYDTNFATGEIFLHTNDNTAYPRIPCYLEGVSTDVFVSGTSSLGNGRYSITLDHPSGAPYTFTDLYGQSLIGQHLIIHSGMQVINGGNNYKITIKTEFKSFASEDIYYLSKGSIAPGNYYWSVCSILDDTNKNYTEWSVEYPLTVT